MNEYIPIITYLINKYETSGRGPGFVSTGYGDIGGQSYGKYQLSSTVGVVDEFVQWLCNYSHPRLANYGKELNKYTINSNGFIKLWQQLGNIDPGNFEKLQDEFALSQYYYPVLQRLKVKYFNIDKHSFAMQSVIFARAIQNGNSGCINLLEYVNEDIFEYPNLSYIDSAYFDNDIIMEIYNFLIQECDSVYWDYNLGYYRSTYNFCHAYNLSVIDGLRNRFVNEKVDALWLLEQYN